VISQEKGEYLERLRRLREEVGELYPLIVDQDGNIIDGQHRREAFPMWHRTTVEVEDETQRALVWLAAHERRKVKRKERSSRIITLASGLMEKGVPRGEIASKIAELLGYSERHILRFLPSKYKAPKKRVAGIKGAKKRVVARASKPKPRLPECPFCKVELPRVLCPKCWSEIELKR